MNTDKTTTWIGIVGALGLVVHQAAAASLDWTTFAVAFGMGIFAYFTNKK